ncbi:MAG: tRNA 2-thiouridine(34) synthase MnmA [Oscillospiraceae bacterium]
MNQNKIAVAVSGGVDSAVCAMLLKNEGFEPTGVVIRFSATSEGCISAARETCETIGIPLSVVDASADFDREVVSPFCAAYCAGRTPNPCVLCNPVVKFAALCQAADDLGCVHISTGHYADIEMREGFFLLKKARCTARDQSYMLSGLSQSQLGRLLLPLGKFNSKQEIRELAQRAGLSCSGAPDSQEICFIPGGNYPAFIHSRGLSGKQGRFIAPDGSVLCSHMGVECYTVGQRRGLGVSLGSPVFVKKIADNGDVVLAFSGGEFSDGVILRNFLLNPYFEQQFPENLTVKIRSAATDVPCKIDSPRACGAQIATLYFETPARAPAPGQTGVIYSGDFVVGSGEITSCF